MLHYTVLNSFPALIFEVQSLTGKAQVLQQVKFPIQWCEVYTCIYNSNGVMTFGVKEKFMQ